MSSHYKSAIGELAQVNQQYQERGCSLLDKHATLTCKEWEQTKQELQKRKDSTMMQYMATTSPENSSLIGSSQGQTFFTPASPYRLPDDVDKYSASSLSSSMEI